MFRFESRFGTDCKSAPAGGFITLNQAGQPVHFCYYLKDHLGNVRSLILPTGGQPGIKQANDYYPFGMSYSNAPGANKHKYNSKEEQEMPGKWLDYGFRFYDSQIARFHAVDPRAEKYYDWSPYTYAINNPINFIDPNGDTVLFAGDAEKAAYNDYKSTVNSRVAAYDRRTQILRDKGRTVRADKRVANRSNNVYVQIQGELSVLENSPTIYRVRMGDNISNTAGGGNFHFNSGTVEMDININSIGEASTMQKLSHELLHAYQFETFQLDLKGDGSGGYLYDQTDELNAINRQNLFYSPGNGVLWDAAATVRSKYSHLSKGPKSFHLFTPQQQTQYKSINKIAKQRGNPPALIYPGWQNDFK